MRRRQFLAASATSMMLGGATTRLAADGLNLKHARRPKPPYRVWFQPRCFHREMDLYRHMTIDASGWLDPRLCERVGRTGLRWVFGTNHPDPQGPEYWTKECSRETLASPKGQPDFVAAGVAIDEWVPPKQPEVEDFIAQGLRAARRANPNLFIVVWYTDLRPALTDLLKDGVVDLGIVQGYTHTADRYGEGAWLAWPTCLRRCEAAKMAGVADKCIFCFGHITDEQSIKGAHLTTQWLDEKTVEIKERFPEMPGVAFFQSDSPDTPELRRLVRHCDRLSGKLWP